MRRWRSRSTRRSKSSSRITRLPCLFHTIEFFSTQFSCGVGGTAVDARCLYNDFKPNACATSGSSSHSVTSEVLCVKSRELATFLVSGCGGALLLLALWYDVVDTTVHAEVERAKMDVAGS